MAKAIANVETVETVKSVTLTLTLDEALSLHGVLGRVGGISEGRNNTDAVYGAVRQALGGKGIDLATWREAHPFAAEVKGDMLRFLHRGNA
jgi:hypothetical protein